MLFLIVLGLQLTESSSPTDYVSKNVHLITRTAITTTHEKTEFRVNSISAPIVPDIANISLSRGFYDRLDVYLNLDISHFDAFLSVEPEYNFLTVDFLSGKLYFTAGGGLGFREIEEGESKNYIYAGPNLILSLDWDDLTITSGGEFLYISDSLNLEDGEGIFWGGLMYGKGREKFVLEYLSGTKRNPESDAVLIGGKAFINERWRAGVGLLKEIDSDYNILDSNINISIAYRF